MLQIDKEKVPFIVDSYSLDILLAEACSSKLDKKGFITLPNGVKVNLTQLNENDKLFSIFVGIIHKGNNKKSLVKSIEASTKDSIFSSEKTESLYSIFCDKELKVFELSVKNHLVCRMTSRDGDFELKLKLFEFLISN